MTTIILCSLSACIGFVTATILNYKAIRKIEKDRDKFCDLYVHSFESYERNRETVNAVVENNRKLNEGKL